MAEVVNAPSGLGHLITVSQRYGHMDRCSRLVLLILLIGVVTTG